jgi:hypothetical protein
MYINNLKLFKIRDFKEISVIIRRHGFQEEEMHKENDFFIGGYIKKIINSKLAKSYDVVDGGLHINPGEFLFENEIMADYV